MVVEEVSFTRQTLGESQEQYVNLSKVTLMLLDELQSLPEYEQLRLLADLKERKARGGLKFAPPFQAAFR